jgi:hypothetical protein
LEPVSVASPYHVKACHLDEQVRTEKADALAAEMLAQTS